MSWIVVLLLVTMTPENFEHELDFLSKLRELSFFRLATKQGARLLDQNELNKEQRIQTTVEHSKSFAALALNSRGRERDDYWQKALSVLKTELNAQPAGIAKFLLNTQLAFTTEQKAEWTIREAEIRSQTDKDWANSRSELRQAIKGLKKLKDEGTTASLRRTFANNPVRLQELQLNIDYQLARAYLHQAIAYSNRPVDRANAVTQAIALLKPIASLRTNEDLVWKSRIDQIRCLRLLGQFVQARSQIKNNSNAPQKHVGSLAAEGVRLALDMDQLDAALTLVQDSAIDATSAEYQLARIETFVKAAEQKEVQSTEFEQQAAKLSTALGKQHGVYWALRGEILLSRLASNSSDVNTDLLKNAAETMLKSDSPEQAKQLYLRAAEQADREGHENAFDYYFKAAVVDHREGKLESAISQFLQLTKKYPEHPQASEAHLLAIFDAASLYQRFAVAKSAEVNAALSQYEQLLSEHMHLWPESSSANQARIWAAKLAFARRNWQLAAVYYQGITVGSEFDKSAMQQLALVYANWHRQSPATPEETLAERNWLTKRMTQTSNTEVSSILALTLAKLAMAWNPKDYKLGESASLRAQSGLASEAKKEALAWLIVARASTGKFREAQETYAQGNPWPNERLIFMLHQLLAISDGQTDNGDKCLLLKEIVQQVQEPQRLKAIDQLAVQQASADTLSSAEALPIYGQLAGTNPKDFRIQRRYAELLSDQGKHNTALQQWRRVVNQSKKQSVDWFRAKLEVAKCQISLGNRKQAQDLIEYMQAIYPELGGPELKNKFESVLYRSKS